MSYIEVDVKTPPDLETLAKESGYTVEEIETYLWCADFAGMTRMKLPDRNYVMEE